MQQVDYSWLTNKLLDDLFYQVLHYYVDYSGEICYCIRCRYKRAMQHLMVRE